MRYSFRILIFALPAVFISLFWMGALRWAQADSTEFTKCTQVVTNAVRTQEPAAPKKLAQAETQVPTRVPRPTPTPLAIPPPSNPNTIQLMVIFGILVVLVVIFGLLLNRNRVF